MGYFYNLDQDPGPWILKTWTLKNLDLEKHEKRLDKEKWLEDHIYNLLTLKIC